MVKQVQKTSSKNLKLYIITSIKEQNKLPSDVPKNKCSYHLKPFLKAELIEKKGYGVWELTDKGKKIINLKQLQKQKLYTLPKSRKIKNSKVQKIRGHGYRWHIKLPARAYYSINKRIKVCDIAKLKYRKLNNGVIATEILGHKTHLANRSINVWINPDVSYLGSSASESHREALFDFKKIISILERRYGVSLRINKRYKFKTSFKHYGDLGNDFAKEYRKNKDSLRVFDNGKEWLVIDFSEGKFEELETTDNERNIYDMDSVITPTMNTLRHEPNLLCRLRDENQELKEMLLEVQKVNKLLLSEHQKSVNMQRFIN
jgi:hypothetical protein